MKWQSHKMFRATANSWQGWKGPDKLPDPLFETKASPVMAQPIPIVPGEAKSYLMCCSQRAATKH